MTYQATIEKIRAGRFSREELQQLHANAKEKWLKGDQAAEAVLNEIKIGKPSDDFFVFMGFCPNAELANRLDIDWKKQGVCTFDYVESERQMSDFEGIHPGDLIILKKIEDFGKTMTLHGHGRVVETRRDPSNGLKILSMNWSLQEEVIEVPLLGCFSTVNLRSRKQVEDAMPQSFYGWLGDEFRGTHPS